MKYALLILFLAITVNAQRVVNNQLLVFPQGLVIESYNSIGFSNMSTSTISEISTANPASLYQFNNFSTGVMFQYSSESNLYEGVTYTRANQWIPTSFGISYPLDNFRFGLAYHQKYNDLINFGEFEISSVERPEGTGEYFTATSEKIIHSPSLLINYNLPGIFNNNDLLSFGLQVFWDFLCTEEKISNTTGRINGNDFSWKLGILYEYKEDLYISMLFEKGSEIEGEIESEPSTLFDPDSGFDGSVVFMPSTYYIKLPHKAALGFTVRTIYDLQVSFTVAAIFWAHVHDNYQNQIELSAGVIYDISESFDISIGFYSSDLNSSSNELFSPGLNYNVHYLGVGLKWTTSIIDIQMEILNSDLFSAEKRKQTHLKLGLNYQF